MHKAIKGCLHWIRLCTAQPVTTSHNRFGNLLGISLSHQTKLFGLKFEYAMSSQRSGGALCWSRRSAFAWSKPVHRPWFTPSIKSKPPCEQHTYLQQRFAIERGVDSAQLSEELTDGRSRSHDSEDRSVDGWKPVLCILCNWSCALCPVRQSRVPCAPQFAWALSQSRVPCVQR